MSRVLLTGGAGFIGAHLAERLLEDGKTVRVLDTMERDALSILGLQERVELVKGSVLDRDLVRSCVHGCEKIVHLASVAGVPTVIGNPAKTMRVILAGTLNVLDAALVRQARVVNVSTSEVYGPYAYRADEQAVTSLPPVGQSPRWSYATAKLAAEHLVDAYHHEHHLPTVNVRPCNVYGPAQVGVGAINNFMQAISDDRPLEVYGDGTQIRSWCYISDMIELLLRCLDDPSSDGEVFNAANPGAVLTMNELADRVSMLSGASVARAPLPYPDVEIRVLDVGKAYRLLGWEPSVTLDDGLGRLIEWHHDKKGVMQRYGR